MFTRHKLCENFRKTYVFLLEWRVPLQSDKSNSRGVSILIRQNLNIKVNCIEKDRDGNIVVLDIIYKEKKITLATKQRFTYVFYFDIIDKIGNDTYVICGDFNLVLDKE